MATIRPVVWSRTEPELPPPPAPSGPAAAAQAPPPATPPAASAGPRLPAFLEPGTTPAFLWEHMDQLTTLLRGWRGQAEAVTHEGPLAGLSPRHVTAALLRGAGTLADTIFRRLRDPALQEWVARAVADEPPVTRRTALAAQELVRRRIESGDYIEDGGGNLALELLKRTLGPAGARRLLRLDEESWLARLSEIPAEQLAPAISHEHPQTIALLLSQLEPRPAAGILSQLPARMQADVAYRLATLDRVPPDNLYYLEQSLAATLDIVTSSQVEVGGPTALGRVLNYAGSSVESNVLEQMEAQDEPVAEATREAMFTFEDIARMVDGDVRRLQAGLEIRDQAIVLKAATEPLKDKWLGNLTEEQRRELTETMEALGPMRLGDVQQVQRRVVGMARQLEEKGEVVIVRGDAGPSGTFV